MKKTLHLLTNESDATARELIARQRVLPDCQVETVDLTNGEPDYADLLQKIFAADSVAVW